MCQCHGYSDASMDKFLVRKSIFLTGVSGFVGSSLLCTLTKNYPDIYALVRRNNIRLPECVKPVLYDLSGQDGGLIPSLTGVDVIIHLAARAHTISDHFDNALAQYRKLNVEGTVNLAKQAADAGVKRFIFVSSIKVNGECTDDCGVFSASSISSPLDPYGISKHEAELALQCIASDTGMEVVIIRPPLVYGAGVKGNFAALSRIVRKGLPLPLGAIHNSRTMVGIDNLISLIITCIDHPSAANQVFLAGDAEDLSTSELLRRVAKAMGKPSRLIPVPQSWLLLTAILLGRQAVAQRLFGSLQIDISKARNLLGWEPPVSVDEGLRRCFADSNNP